MSRKLVPLSAHADPRLRQVVDRIWNEEFLQGHCGEFTLGYLPGDGWGFYLCYHKMFNEGKKGKEADCACYWVMMHWVEQEYNKCVY